ncbi:HYR domain-containing protein [Algoriphagus marinus]|uniref:HYR domain-containing protein n=1 Tax=Algoriphagus marinus TaxID=1925762 RepID=UPI0009FAF976|nr:HYR domain-containing protein [Algoriphagus marinus]
MTGNLLRIGLKVCVLFILILWLIPTTQGQIINQTQNFDYSGGPIQQYIIPSGVTSVAIEVLGADGGSILGSTIVSGGKGATAIGTFSVNPGDVLELRIGAAGPNATLPKVGANGISILSIAPGGGDASAVYFMSNPLVIAGGGGGSGGTGPGFGGTNTTTGGTSGGNPAIPGGSNGSGGQGGGWISESNADAYGGAGGGGYLSGGANGDNSLNIVDLPSAGPGVGGGILKGGTGGIGIDAGFGGGGGGGGGYSGGGGAFGGGGTFNTSITNGGGGGSFVSNIGTNITISAGSQGGGNGSNGKVIFILNPNSSPLAVAKPLVLSAGENCQAVAVATDFDGGSTDPDGDVLGFSIAPAGPYPLGVTPVTLTVTDSKGASSTASTTITVEDTTPPVLVVKDVFLTIGPDGTADADPTTNGVLVSQYDNCEFEPPIVSNGEVYTCANVGTIRISLTFEDFAGNKASASYTVTITDPNGVCNQPPTAQAANFFVTADANCQGTATATDFDNGSFDPDGDDISFSLSPLGPYPLGRTRVEITVTDSKGASARATAEVVVQDKTAPVITAIPASRTINNDPGQCGAIVDFSATASDNCSGTTISYSQDPNTSFPIGTTTVTVDATDAAGNASVQKSFTITVVDAEAPVITAIPASRTINNDAGQCGAIVDFSATASDNCPGTTISYSQDPNTLFPIGTTTVTVDAVDAAGNAAVQKSFTITVVDAEAPVITAIPAIPVTINNDAGQCGAIVDFSATVSDNCPGTTISYSQDPNTSFPIGTTTVTVDAVDAAGNSAEQKSFTITVVDAEAPVITVISPTPTAVLGLTNTVTLLATDIFAATDNCSGVVFSPAAFTFDCDNLGDNVVSVSVTDAAGNMSNANATVNISDNIPLTIDASESGTPVPLGSDAVLKATVSPAVEGVEVTFSLNNGAYVDTDLTDASGIATITVLASDLGSLPVVYKVSATIVECTGLVESVAYLPIYDPNGNFVSGGGWIMSPAGAYKADESLTGKANFGFVSKYKKGSNQVDGNTDFQFKAGDLKFKSTFHESGTLVISGKKATYRGEGTINDVPGFRFTLVALDGDYNGGSAPDEFRIKIWGDSGIIYDNGLGTDDNSDASTILGGGSITIHQAKGRSNKRVVADLVAVPWNTPVEVIEKKISEMSSDWFEGKDVKLNVNTESYNGLQSGFYKLQTELVENEWFELEEPITVNVLVADKPLPTGIELSNSIMRRDIKDGSVIGDLRTIDPVDDQHTYSIAENSDFDLAGNSLIWKGTAIPLTARFTVFSTDRAGQTIEREIELSREPRFGDFNMFPNPAESDVTLEVELDQTVNVGIRIFDAVGRLVYEEDGIQSGNSVYQINIGHLSSGLYTVQVQTGELVMNKRLIKK